MRIQIIFYPSGAQKLKRGNNWDAKIHNTSVDNTHKTHTHSQNKKTTIKEKTQRQRKQTNKKYITQRRFKKERNTYKTLPQSLGQSFQLLPIVLAYTCLSRYKNSLMNDKKFTGVKHARPHSHPSLSHRTMKNENKTKSSSHHRVQRSFVWVNELLI